MSYKNIYKKYQISSQTLREWAHQQRIRYIAFPGGKRLYANCDVEHVLNSKNTIKSYIKKKKICYARVSSSHQKEDLQRQIEFFQTKFPDHEIISDIGSGLNWKRKGLQTLLEHIHNDMVETIVVSDKDRLCRFGFEIMEWICQKHQCTIMVYKDDQTTTLGGKGEFEHELSEDIISIITFFTAKTNGLRAGRNRKRRREDGNDGNDGNEMENKEDTIVSH